MMVIGLTGSFGTGKTFVASIFKSFGARIIDADKLARDALTVGSDTHKRIVTVFGEKILSENRNIDRRKLAGIVFNDKYRLNELNQIIHPVVIRKIKEVIKKRGEKDIVVIDAPLLIEANLAGLVDRLVVVKASQETQITRCMKKFGIKKIDVLNRIKMQIPLKKKVELADYVVDNDGPKSKTRKQVKEIWRKLWK